MKGSKRAAEQKAGNYASLRASAVKMLNVAITYAEDGAIQDAISRAHAAITVLEKAAIARKELFGM